MSNDRIYKWDAVTGKQLGSWVPPFASEGKFKDWALTTPEGQAWLAQSRRSVGLDSKLNLPKVMIGPTVASDRTYLFSPDGKMLAVRHVRRTGPGRSLVGPGEDKITLHEMPAGKLLHTIPSVGVGRVEFFAPDGKLLATFADVASPEPCAGAFSPDGRYIALDPNDGTVVLYELATGQVRHTFGIVAAGNKVGLGPLPRTGLERRVVLVLF